MAFALFLFIVPLVWIIVAKVWFHRKYVWKEAAVQFGISCVVVVVLTGLVYMSKGLSALDVEIHNGQVTSKYSERTSCSHSYECPPCYTHTNSDGTTYQTCSTCYDHPFDVDWKVDTTVGNITIPRVNSQGTIEPPRFSEVVVNEPASREKRYHNFIKANPDSIFNTSEFTDIMEGNEYALPNYPKVHDFYRLNRVVITDPQLPRSLYRTLNQGISMELRSLGAEKEVNVVMVLTTEPSSQYATALEYEWLGGKKNDIVIVMGLDVDTLNVDWIDTFGWSSNSRIHVALHDAFQGQVLDVNTTPSLLSSLISEHYERQSFSEYEYLMDELEPSFMAMFIAFIINIMVTLGVGYYFIKNDVF